VTNPADCEGCATVREEGGTTCGDCGTFLPLLPGGGDAAARGLAHGALAGTRARCSAGIADAEHLHGKICNRVTTAIGRAFDQGARARAA
jgi:hypothetical protein